MKSILSIVFFVLFVAVSSVLAEELPQRKPGLWEIQTTVQGAPGVPVIKQCIDEATDAKLMDAGTKSGQACAKQEIRRDGSNYVAESDCAMGKTKVHSEAVFSGDFASGYEASVFSTYSPPLMGMASTKVKLKGRWLGPCEAGQRPGDVIMHGGMKINIDSMPDMGSAVP